MKIWKKNTLFALTFLLLACCQRGMAQQEPGGFELLRQSTEAQERSDTPAMRHCIRQAAEWFERHPDPGQVGRTSTRIALGRLLSWQNQLDSALYLFQVTLNEMPAAADSLHAVIYDQMGFCYDNKGRHGAALQAYQKALTIGLACHRGAENYRDVALYTADVGGGYFRIGDVSRGITYMRRAIALFEKLPITTEGLLARTWMNLGSAMLNYAPEKAHEAFQKALDLYGNLSAGNQAMYQNVIYHSMAAAYLQQFRLADAVVYQKKSAALAQNPLYGYNWYLNAAGCSCAEGKTDAAKKSEGLRTYAFLEQAVQGNADALGQLYYSRSFWCHMFHGEYTDAATAADEGLQKIGFHPGQFTGTSVQPLILTALLGIRAGALLEIYRRDKNLDALQTAYATACQADTLAIITRRFGTLDASQANILALVREVMEMRIACAYHLRQEALQRGDAAAALRFFTEAFETLERNKQFELLEDMRRNASNTVPETLILRREELLSALNDRRQQMASDSALLPKMDKDLFDLLLGLEKINRLIDSLNYLPANPSLPTRNGTQLTAAVQKPMPEVAGVLEICRSLAADQAFLNYFVGDTSCFVLLLQRDGPVAFQELPYPYPVIKAWTAQLRAGILGLSPDSAAANYPARQQSYVQAARQLYEGLLRPVAAHLKPRLLISADGPLAIVPFEALLERDPRPGSLASDLPYVLVGHAVSQPFSATLWRFMQRNGASARSTGFSGFAPSYPANSGLAVLDNAREIADIKRYFGTPARTFDGAGATKSAFFKALKNTAAIHVAAHALAYPANGELSSIYFADSAGVSRSGCLTGYELQSRRSGCQLVSLSACETAIGEFRAGEGLIGLQREFAGIGVGAVAATLWSVNTNSTGEIFQGFYARLADKKIRSSKDVALAAAKRDYLQRSVANYQPERCYPYYWSGISLAGDLSPLRY